MQIISFIFSFIILSFRYSQLLYCINAAFQSFFFLRFFNRTGNIKRHRTAVAGFHICR